MQGLGLWGALDVAPKDLEERVAGVICMALDIHLAVGVVQKREQVQGAVTNVFEFLQSFSGRIGLHVGHEPRQHLDAGALIEEEQVGRWIHVQGDQVLHLGEEVRVGDVKKIPRQVRLELVALENALNGGLARRSGDDIGPRQKLLCSETQRPFSAVRCGGSLAVEGDDAEPGLLEVDSGSSGPAAILEAAVGAARHPAPHGLD